MGKKVTIIGAGSVGSTIAYTMAVNGIATEIVMIDINEAKAMGEKEITAIIRAYKKAMDFPSEPDEAQLAWIHEQEGKDITRGHYFRGVL